MKIRLTNVATKSPRVRRLLTTADHAEFEGTKLAIVGNKITLDEKHIANIIEYGQVFMTNTGNFNKMEIE